uniref:Ankyrin repeat protein n=1 Tax=Grammatophora oceanica TaxID=210454 RepID=A0A7S1Y628_9STRA|mmetsp:Transcript_24625/g.36156  ORF Transcript_24625/g.36156 Transcript_24625/m.36156 type:complete len:120 (+) Transcript_24625:1246-1605(+)
MQQFGPHPCTSHALLIILHVVKYLIESHKMRIDTKDNAGWTRLHVACANDHVDVVVSLVEKRITTTTTTTGHRCIGESRNDHVTVAMYLAQAQCANVSARDKILAVRRNNPVVSQVLRI